MTISNTVTTKIQNQSIMGGTLHIGNRPQTFFYENMFFMHILR